MAVTKTGSGAAILFVADRDPTAADDTTIGARRHTQWLNTSVSPNREYVCKDPTAAAAVWHQIIDATIPTTATGTAEGRNVKFASRNSLTLGDYNYLAEQYSADALGPHFIFGKSRHATIGSQTVVVSGDVLGQISFKGSGGTEMEYGAAIFAEVAGTPGDNDMPGRIGLATTRDGAAAYTNAVYIGPQQSVVVGRQPFPPDFSFAKLRVLGDDSDSPIPVIVGRAQHASFNSDVMKLEAKPAQSTSWNFLRCVSDYAGGVDVEFLVDGAGGVFSDGGTAMGTPADYAERFETWDGQDIPVGECVVFATGRWETVADIDDLISAWLAKAPAHLLPSPEKIVARLIETRIVRVVDGKWQRRAENPKVRLATWDDPPEDIIGVIRPRDGSGSLVMNAGSKHWQGRDERDVFGRAVIEEAEAFQWRIPGLTLFDTDGKMKRREADEVVTHFADRLPKGLQVPPWAERVTLPRRKWSAAFDPERTFVERKDRPEWVVVGLVGQVPVLKGRPVGDRWRLMREKSAEVDEWLIR